MREKEFVLGESIDRVDVDSYASVDVKNYITQNPLFKKRLCDEIWDNYIERENEALNELHDFIFSDLSDKVDLKEIPLKHEDYQWNKWSEIEVTPQYVLGIVFSLNGESKTDPENDLIDFAHENTNSIEYSACLVNSSAIKSYFPIESHLREIMRNSYNYLVEKTDAANVILTKAWLGSTGKGKRTRIIESMSVGEALEWRVNGFKFEILNRSGEVIGEAGTKGESPDRDVWFGEFNSYYKHFIDLGLLDVKSAHISSIIPHGSLNKCPRKALVEIEIELIIKSLPDKCDYSDEFFSEVSLCRRVAAIDYNRKCDILEKKIPEVYDDLHMFFDDIMPSHYEKVNELYEALASIETSELEVIWEALALFYSASRQLSANKDLLECEGYGVRMGEVIYKNTESLTISVERVLKNRMFGQSDELVISLYK